MIQALLGVRATLVNSEVPEVLKGVLYIYKDSPQAFNH